MSSYRITDAALDDLKDIFQYVQESYGVNYAIRTEENLFALLAQLTEFPGLGHRRVDLTARSFLFLTSKPYLIAYELGDTTVIHAVLHGARNIKSIFRKRPL